MPRRCGRVLVIPYLAAVLTVSVTAVDASSAYAEQGVMVRGDADNDGPERSEQVDSWWCGQ